MEYALDAVAELGVPETSFTEADRQWVLDHAPMTWAEIQEATLRLVALRASPSVSRAAERLGMAEVSLRRWIGGRELPPILHDPELRRELEVSSADDQEDGAVDAAPPLAELRAQR